MAAVRTPKGTETDVPVQGHGRWGERAMENRAGRVSVRRLRRTLQLATLRASLTIVIRVVGPRGSVSVESVGPDCLHGGAGLRSLNHRGSSVVVAADSVAVCP